MKIIRTGHPINESVSQLLKQGNPSWEFTTPEAIAANPEPCIGYGILRGCAEAFKACEAAYVEWWQIDRAYAPFLRDSHLRFSYRGTQAAFIPGMETTRLERQKWPEMKPYEWPKDGYFLLLPPTEHVADFFKVFDWTARQETTLAKFDTAIKIRSKNGAEPDSIDSDLTNARHVFGFNSGLMVQALLGGRDTRGASQSMVGDWNQKQRFMDRVQLFSCMANFQFDAEEIKTGFAWKHLEWIRGKYGLRSLYKVGY